MLSKELLAVIMFRLKHIRWGKYNIKHINQVIELLLLSVQLKNLNLLAIWIKKYFESNNLKKHKKLYHLLKYLLIKFIWRFNIYLQVRGVRLKTKGKFAKAGSVRKVRKCMQRGVCSYTTKSLALISRKIIIRTSTGTLGMSLELFFKSVVYFKSTLYFYLYFYNYFFILYV